MIYDIFANCPLYLNIIPSLGKALHFASHFDPASPDGRYDIEGDQLYASVSTYNTRPAAETKFESHKKYIDIQLLLAGREFIDISHDHNLPIETPYSPEKDVTFYHPPKNFSSIILEPTRFAIFFPHDLHSPCRQLSSPQPVRKIVLKLRTPD